MWNSRNRSEIPVTVFLVGPGWLGGLGCIKICALRLGRIKNHQTLISGEVSEEICQMVSFRWFPGPTWMECRELTVLLLSEPPRLFTKDSGDFLSTQGLPWLAGKALQTLDSVPPMSFLTNLFYRVLFPINKKSLYIPHLLPEPISNVERDIGDDANKNHLGIKWWNTF